MGGCTIPTIRFQNITPEYVALQERIRRRPNRAIVLLTRCDDALIRRWVKKPRVFYSLRSSVHKKTNNLNKPTAKNKAVKTKQNQQEDKKNYTCSKCEKKYKYKKSFESHASVCRAG